ncbi:MAG: hypothetical protein H6821_16705 [Planctomycetaceae bacterium]|nr:hypothetical protein [Planctomycetaceae bacterium]MCB9940658.1 hypothetical protein [Planctomycetaceae bacterium]
MFNAVKYATVQVGAVFVIGFAIVCITGCERKETIIDVETPGGELEVERSVDTGEVDVEINKK